MIKDASMSRIITIIALLIVMLWGIDGFYTAQNRPQFEAASLKLEASRTFPRFACHGIDGVAESNPFRGMTPSANETFDVPQGRCLGNIDLQHLVALAYSTQVHGGPAWTSSQQFRIQAKAEDISAATREDLLEMLQKLLSERFALRFHTQTREW